MITTIIPYFLLANVSKIANWENGPEFNFNSEVHVHAYGFNNYTKGRVANMDSHLRCQLKEQDTIRCIFQNSFIYMYSYDEFKQDRKELVYDHPAYVTIPFEVKFNKAGVEKIVVPKNTTEDFRSLMIKTVANWLNVGVVLSDEKYTGANETEQYEEVNFLLGKCTAKVKKFLSNMIKFKRRGLFLKLIPPLEQLNNSYLNIIKSYNTSECSEFTKFFWSEILMEDLDEDSNFNIMFYFNSIDVYEDDLRSFTSSRRSRNIDGEEIEIRETTVNVLSDVYPIREVIPDIEDPITFTFEHDVK